MTVLHGFALYDGVMVRCFCGRVFDDWDEYQAHWREWDQRAP